MENVISNAERRAFHNGEKMIVPRVGDIYAALPSITGKFELEYEGELRGADNVAHELIRSAVGRVYDRYFSGENVSQIVQWFELGGSLKISDNDGASKVIEQIESIQGLAEIASQVIPKAHKGPEMQASAGEFVLDGLYAHRRLSRSEELGYKIEKKKAREGPEQEFPGRGQRRSYN
jgi:magnesium chelatase subunit I